MLIFIFNLSKYKIEGMVYDWMVMAKHWLLKRIDIKCISVILNIYILTDERVTCDYTIFACFHAYVQSSIVTFVFESNSRWFANVIQIGQW